MSSLLIKDNNIDSVTLCKSIPWFLRYDVLPFAIFYGLSFYGADQKDDELYKHYSNIAIPIILTIHLILFLLSQTSVGLKCRIGNVKVKDINDASMVYVKAAKNAGKDRIINLYHDPNINDSNDVSSSSANGSKYDIPICGTRFQIPSKFFEFQKIIYSWDSDKKIFKAIEYPTTGTIEELLKHKGHNNRESLLAEQKWGLNEFDIPVPNFLDLYVEHLVAPFFVFQILCLVLWSMDDYWYYSFVTALMLFLFEGMMCRQRQNSLQNLRAMRRPPVPTLIYRERWIWVLSDRIVPGDIISLSSVHPRFEGEENQKHHSQPPVVPCDALIVRGSCVTNEAMLTGESVPQTKESLNCADEVSGDFEISERGVDATWRRHLVFGGTSLQLHSESAGAETQIPRVIESPSNKGCICVAVRTGYGTCQGGLMRKILFATERVTSDSSETFIFIGILVIFASLASAVVLKYGLEDGTRNRFKLFLHCIMIVTSVVPPELPMELSLAVTNSLAALAHKAVYCTEPFRIPLAGRLDALCFDKTGTLTKDEMLLRGVVGSTTDNNVYSNAITEVENLEQWSWSALSVMGACHSLMISQGNVLGDPLEIATMQASKWRLKGGEDAVIRLKDPDVPSPEDVEIGIMRRYPFTSALKRMSTVAAIKKNDGSPLTHSVVCKGAPEVLEKLITVTPPFYRATYMHHMRQGKRVLAMACRNISDNEVPNLVSASRQNIESNLEFAGFLIFDCDLKPDSKGVIRDLLASNHQIIMITGDGALTAIDVARRLQMFGLNIQSETLSVVILTALKDGSIVWRNSLSEKVDSEKDETDITFNINTIQQDLRRILVDHSLCITGAAIDALKRLVSDKTEVESIEGVMRYLAPSVAVFARVSPEHKETIVHALKGAGKYVLMAGDGANDVGALKAAHVGVSIVNDSKIETYVAAQLEEMNSNSKNKRIKDRAKRAELESQLDPTIVNLGDASIASPFTSRRTSIDSVMSVLRQGRCTLVTTIEIYKILALNCLISAYMMSTLYLRGLKQGDMQMTAMGIVTAALFYFLSVAKPMPILSSVKPSPSVFSSAVIVSILGQFIVHLGCLLGITELCSQYTPSIDEQGGGVIPDGKFRPTLLNTCIFLLSAVMQTNNFVVNYRGEPFTQGIMENSMMWLGVRIVYAVLFVAASGLFEPLTDLLELSAFPDPQLRSYVYILLGVDFAGCFLMDRIARNLEN